MLQLREERIKVGVSIRKLSRQTEIAEAHISLMERGLCPAWPGWRSRISKALQIPEDVLFQESTESDPDHQFVGEDET